MNSSEVKRLHSLDARVLVLTREGSLLVIDVLGSSGELELWDGPQTSMSTFFTSFKLGFSDKGELTKASRLLRDWCDADTLLTLSYNSDDRSISFQDPVTRAAISGNCGIA